MKLITNKTIVTREDNVYGYAKALLASIDQCGSSSFVWNVFNININAFICVFFFPVIDWASWLNVSDHFPVGWKGCRNKGGWYSYTDPKDRS